MSFRDNLQHLRAERNMTQEQLAMLLGVSRQSVTKWEAELSLGCGEPDFEDGLIRACAELNDVDVILTRGPNAFKRSKVRAMTCAEYLELFG